MDNKQKNLTHHTNKMVIDINEKSISRKDLLQKISASLDEAEIQENAVLEAVLIRGIISINSWEE